MVMNNIPQWSEVVYHGGGGLGGGAASYKKKLKSLYILSKKCADALDIKISIIDICYANTAPIPKTLIVSLLHKWKIE